MSNYLQREFVSAATVQGKTYVQCIDGPWCGRSGYLIRDGKVAFSVGMLPSKETKNLKRGQDYFLVEISEEDLNTPTPDSYA